MPDASNIAHRDRPRSGPLLRAPSPDAKVPLYRQIADALLLEIRGGRFGIGEILPSELELAAQLKVSRGSVREALQILADGQVVERVRKLGTRVLRKEPQEGYVQRLDSLNEALGFGGDTVMRIDDVRDVSGADEIALQNEISLTGHWLQITGVRHLPDDEEALTTWSRVFVNGPLSGVRPMLTRAVPSIYRLIEQAYSLRVVRLRHRITAIALPDYAALTLGLPAGMPALQVDAWLYATDGMLVEFVRSIHDPRRFSMEFSTQSAG